MPIESLDARKEFAVVAARYQDLCMRSYGSLEDGEGAACELMLLESGDFELAVGTVSNSALSVWRLCLGSIFALKMRLGRSERAG